MSEEIKKQWSEETLEAVDKLCLFDDDFMSLVFDRNIEATEYLLNTIFERSDMKVIEVQRADSGAVPQRARFHSAMVDTRMLKEKEKFKEIKDSYVIFITQNDVMKGDLPLYHVERVVKEPNRDFGDGSHIIYVNGAYKNDDTEIGRLVHDFGCVRAADMYNEILKKQVHYFKETEGGREVVCQIIDDVAESRADAKVQSIIAEMLNDFEPVEKIKKYTGVSKDKIIELAKSIGVSPVL